jgi:uncharacterized RDD family membrane protein YckC
MEAAGVQYAGFWNRTAAHLIDLLVAVLLFSPFEIALFSHSSLKWEDYAADPRYTVARCFVSATVFWLYVAFMESSKKQATLGKRVVGVIVTDMKGDRISFGRATARFFSHFLCDLTCAIGYLIVALSRRKQALHDLIAGTVVVVRPSQLKAVH